MAVRTAPIGNSSSVKGGIAVVALGNAPGQGTIIIAAGQVTALKPTITVSNEGGSTASGTLGRNDSGKRRRRARRLRRPLLG